MTVSPILDLAAAPARPRASAPHGDSTLLRLSMRIGQALRRLAGSAAVVLGVLTVTFLVTRVFAPDPTSLFLGAAGNGYTSPAAEAAARAAVRTQLGLNTSLLHQYFHFINQVLHGNLGTSFESGRSVSRDLWSRLPATVELGTYALIFGVALGVLAGVLSAVRRDGIFDRVARLGTVASLALPQFWIGLMLLWIFFTKLHWLPGPLGRLNPSTPVPRSITGFYVIDALLTGNWSAAWDAIRHLVLPVFTLGIGLAGPIAKSVRTSMMEALASDYVRTARALGFGRRRIWLVYALKNGLLPVVTLLAGIIGYTFCGSILVEGVFGWPGVGNYSLQAIRTSDFPAIQGFVIYATVLYVVIYELLNVVYRIVDPRVKK
jgi:peptide/nickel transport system permease protein